MEWLVIDVLYLRTTGNYALTLQASILKMMAEVTSESPILPGDSLYPVIDAKYLINKNETRHLKVISATVFSEKQWRFLKRLSRCQTTTTAQTVLNG
ncbi:polymyxin B resistance protein pmrD [Enterobacter asburiae]|uniref:polymyxin B resistance protein pmrD n=1 Tax=Scandinavium sp. UTDF21-P1B TaxID=3446379 RepID=UPI00347289E4